MPTSDPLSSSQQSPAAADEASSELARSLKELEDVRYALNQSAIVATTDVSGRIKYVNEKFCEISKYPASELLGQDHRILNSRYHGEAFMRELWRTIAHGAIWRGELRNRTKEGTLYWVDTTIVPFLTERGKPWQYMAIRYDITERKRQEARLLEQSALARVGEMAAVVAHEVRNPLAGIRGALQVIGSRMPAGTPEIGVLHDVLQRIDSLNGIVDDLLLFARPRELRAARLPLGPFLAQAAAWVTQDEAMREVRIAVAPTDAVIEGDAEQLRIVFTNLLLNAAQAIDRHGRIAVSIAETEAACTIAVCDTGPGIPEELRERIFEPFFTTKHRGTGLGLPTARRIIDAHGGTITIACPADEGTRVEVTLPKAAAHRA